jgi:hypothetical protein
LLFLIVTLASSWPEYPAPTCYPPSQCLQAAIISGGRNDQGTVGAANRGAKFVPKVKILLFNGYKTQLRMIGSAILPATRQKIPVVFWSITWHQQSRLLVGLRRPWLCCTIKNFTPYLIAVCASMKVTETNYRPTAAQIRRKTTGSAGSTSFSDVFSAVDSGSAENAGGTTASQSAAAASNIGSLLALQEVSEDEVRRQRAIQRAQTQLQALERLRQALLSGAIPMHTLRELEHSLSRQREHIDDPRLLEILDEVELRVAVEIAKIEVANGNFA